MLGGSIGTRLATKAGAIVDVLLTCDPVVAEANRGVTMDGTQTVLDSYLETGDMTEIRVPEGATHIGIRVLTEDEMSACYRQAGPTSKLGVIVSERLDGLNGEAETDALERMSTGDRKALAYERGRQVRLMTLVINACVQSISTCDDFEPGRAQDWLATIEEAPLRAEVFHELFAHAMRVNTVGVLGKSSGPQSG